MIRKFVATLALTLAAALGFASAANASAPYYPATEEEAERYVATIESLTPWLARSDRQIARDAEKVCRAARTGDASLAYVIETTAWKGHRLSRKQASVLRSAVRAWCVR